MLSEVRRFISEELKNEYPAGELAAISNIILKHISGKEKHLLLSDPELFISSDDWLKVNKICTDLKKQVPIQYILGETEFYGRTFKLNKHTLIPRQETEELVDLVIKENQGSGLEILDIGTGSACIAICLAAGMKNARVSATDISRQVINLAIQNARLNNTNINFFTDNILKPDFNKYRKYDLIISNPPYVMMSEKEHIAKNVLDYEPHKALFVSDNDPLLYYRSILVLAKKILKPAAMIYFEINEAKHLEMMGLLKDYNYSELRLQKDINGKYRIISGINYEK